MGSTVVEKPAVVQAIYAVIDEINAARPADQQIKKDPATPLFGSQAQLDSLGLVNLVVALEQRVGDDFGAAITLADEKAMSQRNSPFRTVDTLADYVLSLLK